MKNNTSVDFIIIGEGEFTLRELLGTLNDKKSLSDIDGLAFRQNDSIIINPRTKFIENINEIPFPSRELFPFEKYISTWSFWALPRKGYRTASLVTSRGCPIKCIFCPSSIYWGEKYRVRSVENILSEMQSLIDTYKINNFQFIDDNLTLNKERAKQLFSKIIERKLNISWFAPNGISVWTLDEEMVSLMKKSGCYEFTLAIESGNQDVLTKIVKKPLDLEHVKGAVKIVKKYKINTCSFFVLGFPGEKKEQIKETISFARRLKLDRYIFFCATPFPGTEMYEICKREGYISNDYDGIYNELVSPKFETPDFTRKELGSLLRSSYRYSILTYFLKHPVKFFLVWGPLIKYILSHLYGKNKFPGYGRWGAIKSLKQ
jgi:anaerobic magnesium-protoporphyrin IX monomethyl ester cyclase